MVPVLKKLLHVCSYSEYDYLTLISITVLFILDRLVMQIMPDNNSFNVRKI